MDTKYLNFTDTTIGKNYSLKLGEMSAGGTRISEEVVHIICESIVQSISDYARVVKSKEKPVAIVVDDLKGNPVLALKVEYFEGTEDNAEGSWNPVWTFNPEDIKDCTIYPISEHKCHSFFIQRASSHRFAFTTPSNIYFAALVFAQCLKEWLDTNADVNESKGISLPGFFKAAVTVINDEKVFTFSAEEEITNLVKDDAMLQTA